MDKETTTSVTIDRKTFARLDRLAKSNNVSKKEFLSCALEYFEKYGINPVEHESPAKEMQKLIKRCDQVIAFIRKQEQDFLRPACEAMGSTSMRVTMSMDSILTEKKFSQYQKDNEPEKSKNQQVEKTPDIEQPIPKKKQQEEDLELLKKPKRSRGFGMGM